MSLDSQEAQLMLTNPRDAMLCRPAKFGEDQMMRGPVIAYCRFSKLRRSAILDFHIFAIFVENSNLRLYLRRHAKFREDRMMRG